MKLPQAMKIFAALVLLIAAGLVGALVYSEANFARKVQLVKPYDEETRKLKGGEIGDKAGKPFQALVFNKAYLLGGGEPDADGALLWDISGGNPRPTQVVTLRIGLGTLAGILFMVGALSWVVASRTARRIGQASPEAQAPGGDIQRLVDMDNDQTMM